MPAWRAAEVGAGNRFENKFKTVLADNPKLKPTLTQLRNIK
jgi:hypothetical protein